MDNNKLPAYSFIEWTPLGEHIYTLFHKDAIFRAIYNSTGETMLFGGYLDGNHKAGARISISTGGGMLLSNLSNIEYALVDKIHPYPPKTESPTEFTKIEKSALMIAQGMLANSPDWSEKDISINWVGVNSVKYAKAVLEEANK